MPHGKILYRYDEPINHVYFPDASKISIVAMTAEGQTDEAGVIGWEVNSGI